VREIYVSLVGDQVHAGDKALTRETPAQRGRVNRYALQLTTTNILLKVVSSTNKTCNTFFTSVASGGVYDIKRHSRDQLTQESSHCY
jgi:hypothetical protein